MNIKLEELRYYVYEISKSGRVQYSWGVEDFWTNHWVVKDVQVVRVVKIRKERNLKKISRLRFFVLLLEISMNRRNS